jgi:hypothetical protein
VGGRCESVTILNGSIAAIGGFQASGIGTRNIGQGTESIESIIILSERITANGGDYGAGIGTGDSLSGGIGIVGTIMIENGNITAK